MLPHEFSSEDSEAEVEYRSPCVVSEKSECENSVFYFPPPDRVGSNARASGRQSGFSVRRYLDDDEAMARLNSFKDGVDHDDASRSQVINNLRTVRRDMERSQFRRLLEQMCDVGDAENRTEGSEQRYSEVNCVTMHACT